VVHRLTEASRHRHPQASNRRLTLPFASAGNTGGVYTEAVTITSPGTSGISLIGSIPPEQCSPGTSSPTSDLAGHPTNLTGKVTISAANQQVVLRGFVVKRQWPVILPDVAAITITSSATDVVLQDLRIELASDGETRFGIGCAPYDTYDCRGHHFYSRIHVLGGTAGVQIRTGLNGAGDFRLEGSTFEGQSQVAVAMYQLSPPIGVQAFSIAVIFQDNTFISSPTTQWWCAITFYIMVAGDTLTVTGNTFRAVPGGPSSRRMAIAYGLGEQVSPVLSTTHNLFQGVWDKIIHMDSGAAGSTYTIIENSFPAELHPDPAGCTSGDCNSDFTFTCLTLTSCGGIAFNLSRNW
jgi:hypothetical protein